MPATATTCRRCGAPAAHAMRVGHHELANFCETCYNNYGTPCNYCGDMADAASTSTSEGWDICPRCVRFYYANCCGCGELYPIDDLVWRGGNDYCPACVPSLRPFPVGYFEPTGQFARVGSYRRYGIELETAHCPNSNELADSTWGAKHDCTISGLEFVSPVLEGDGGLEAVQHFGRVARVNGWTADENCGFHLHLDQRGCTSEEKFAVAYAFRVTEKVWFSFVEHHRSDCNGYGAPCEWGTYDLDRHIADGNNYAVWADMWERYNWINCSAHYVHGTLEIRNHEGTCDTEAICNWVKACLRFADWAERTGYDQVKRLFAECKDEREMFEVITEFAWKDDKLAGYYADKARRLHGKNYAD